MAAAFGACHLCGQALKCEAAVIKAGQWINHGQIAQDVGVALFFGKLAAKAFDEDLLIDGVDVEKDNQGE